MKIHLKQFLKRLTAGIVAMSMSASLAVNSFAGFTGSSTGSSGFNYQDGVHYGFSDGVAHVSWRISLYVSTSDNGKIDETKDSIVNQKGLGFVGSIIYDNFPDGVTKYYQTEYTADRRNSFTADFPKVAQVKSKNKEIPGSTTPNGSPIYIRRDPNLLPTTVQECAGTAVEDMIEGVHGDPEYFTTKVIQNLNECLGGTSTGSKKDFSPLYAKVIQAGTGLGSVPTNKLNAAKDTMGAEAFSLLLPVKDGKKNEDCIVEWACVVEPIQKINTITGDAFFDLYLYDTDTFKFSSDVTYTGLGETGATLGLDAYAFASYNEYSKSYYADPNVLDEIGNTIDGFDPCAPWGEASTYTACGKLRAEFGKSNSLNWASVNYDTHDGEYYLGIATTPDGFDAEKHDVKYHPKYFAEHGGISIYQTEIEESPTIPVYYYLYDANNKCLGEVKEETFDTTTPGGFVPSQEYGVPIATMSITDKKSALVSSSGKYMYFYRAENSNAKVRRTVIDWKGTSAKSEWAYPEPITDPTATSGPVLDTTKPDVSKDAKSIHVKVIQMPVVEVYYHIYNYIVPDDQVAQYNLADGQDILDKLAENGVTEPTSTELKQETLADSKTYQASVSGTAYGVPVHVTGD